MRGVCLQHYNHHHHHHHHNHHHHNHHHYQTIVTITIIITPSAPSPQHPSITPSPLYFRTAFATWLITLILFFVVISYASLFLGITGSIMVLGNIIYGTLRWGPDLVIPFNSHAKLEPTYGWCFYLSLLTGSTKSKLT